MSEENFKLSRRRFLQAGAVGTMLSAGYSASAIAQSDTPHLSDYQPEYFTAAEWDFIVAATDRLIPADGEGPGALDAHVPIFIDRQLVGSFGQAADWYMEGPHDPNAPAALGYQSPLTPAEAYRAGIAELNTWCKENHGAVFAELEKETKDAVLTSLEKGDIELADTKGANLFDLLLQNTKEGYFADPMYGGNHEMAAWNHIGFPGARASFREWVGIEKPYPLGPVDISGKRG
ncbi:gluconate 2-dehydrogenase subunit 3 family protein [Thalassospira sp. UBA1131]|uniref:gluconate 2-dehydrogenase subunit 3 family protein n=1 Tax=Thalassospira sp. UBA1131 TaxID=1947672 RepID=UPI0025CCAC3F|nr:gluconate 2-dehydrogenase subunit 3 family protein [Thalassospira sp. UBA1131]